MWKQVIVALFKALPTSLKGWENSRKTHMQNFCNQAKFPNALFQNSKSEVLTLEP